MRTLGWACMKADRCPLDTGWHRACSLEERPREDTGEAAMCTPRRGVQEKLDPLTS